MHNTKCNVLRLIQKSSIYTYIHNKSKYMLILKRIPNILTILPF